MSRAPAGPVGARASGLRLSERERQLQVLRIHHVAMLEQNRIERRVGLCIAPLEKPQLAMAVIVEGGGYGSRSAAPIAAALVLKARDLGYFR